MSTVNDDQIETWIERINDLTESDQRPKREKVNDALHLQTQIHERLDALNAADSYLLDVVTRVGSLIDKLVHE